ncbi:uncharacterized protein TNCV_2826021 [Trichonephila clavipes]|nr:uncharacterized protein TNCV_2826021 [Trichonephila clavipes]
MWSRHGTNARCRPGAEPIDSCWPEGRGANWEQENMLPFDQKAMGLFTLHRRVQIYLGERFKAFADLERTTGYTDLYVFDGRTLRDVRYRDEILDLCILPYACAIGNNFYQMEANVQAHQAKAVEDYLESHGVERME